MDEHSSILLFPKKCYYPSMSWTRSASVAQWPAHYRHVLFIDRQQWHTENCYSVYLSPRFYALCHSGSKAVKCTFWIQKMMTKTDDWLTSCSYKANSHCINRCRPTATVSRLQYVTSQTFQDWQTQILNVQSVKTSSDRRQQTPTG